MCISKNEAKEKLGKFVLSTPVLLKTCNNCVRKQNVGLWQNSKAERDTVMDLSLCHQKGQRESDWKFYLSYLGSSQQKSKEKKIHLVLKYWENKEKYLPQKWGTLNTAIYLLVDMSLLCFVLIWV